MDFHDELIKEKLSYLMYFLDHYIEQTVYNVLSDSDCDPQYSAVSTANLIECYKDVMTQLKGSCYYNDLQSYFAEKLLSSEEYQSFEEKRKKEDVYYIGKRY